MNAAQINYLHPSEELRARARREMAALEARAATAITVTLPVVAALALTKDAEDHGRRAQARADDTSKTDESRAHWRERAAYWDSVVETMDAALDAQRVRR